MKTKITLTKGDDGIFNFLPFLYYDKIWNRFGFGFLTMFVEITLDN